MRAVRPLLGACILSALLSPSLFAQPRVALVQGRGRYDVGASLRILRDIDGLLTPAEALTRSGSFVQSSVAVPSMGFTRGVTYLLLTIENRTEREDWVLEVAQPPLDRVELHLVLPTGPDPLAVAGDTLSYTPDDPSPGRTPSFAVTLPPGAQTTYLIRVRMDGYLVLPVRVWDPEVFRRHERIENLLLGGFFGILLAMVAYNLLIYAGSRETLYLYYILFVASHAFYQLSSLGVGTLVLWPSHPDLNAAVILLAAPLAAPFGLLVTRVFLAGARTHPSLRRVLDVCLFLAVVNIPFSLLIDRVVAFSIMNALAAGFALVALVTAALALNAGYAPARIYLIAWGTLLVAVIVTTLRNFGWLPWAFLTSYALPLGSLVEVVLLSLALAERIADLRRAATDAERRLREQGERSRQGQKLEAIGRLAAGVAHDFNNLVTIITGYADTLLDRLEATHPAQIEAQAIRAAATRAGALTRQLMAFSRKQVLHPEPLDPNQLLKNMHGLLSRLLGEGVLIDLELGDVPGVVVADPNQLEQVVLNLATNARDAMPQGGVLTLETHTTLVGPDDGRSADLAPGRYAVITVTDTGTGIAEEHLGLIFEPFFTTKEEGRGTGLGLPTAYGTVRQSGGTILVTSRPGAGATFRVYLPMTSDGVPVVAPSAAAARPETRVPGGETILVVEDEEPLRLLAEGLFRGRGYTVLSASTGPEALEIARCHTGSIDLLVADVGIAGLNGLDLADQLVRQRPGLKVLLVSGYPQGYIVPAGAGRAVSAFLDKPYTPRALLERARELLTV